MTKGPVSSRSRVTGKKKKKLKNRNNQTSAWVLTWVLIWKKYICVYEKSRGNLKWEGVDHVRMIHLVSNQGWNLCPLRWKCTALTPGPPGKSWTISILLWNSSEHCLLIRVFLWHHQDIMDTSGSRSFDDLQSLRQSKSMPHDSLVMVFPIMCLGRQNLEIFLVQNPSGCHW